MLKRALLESCYSELGPTHQSIEDIARLRAINNMTIVPGKGVDQSAYRHGNEQANNVC